MPTWTIIRRQPGQNPAPPALLLTASAAMPATYVPWLPALLVASVEPLRTFQVEEICPSKSLRPLVLIPVSRIAMTTELSPLVISQAWVVCVIVQPQAPPPNAKFWGKDGSFGTTSCAWSMPSASTKATSGRAFNSARTRFRASAGTCSTRTPRSGTVRTHRAPSLRSIATVVCDAVEVL